MVTISVEHEPDLSEVVAGIRAGLDAFNAQHVLLSPTLKFAIAMRDAAEAEFAGLEGQFRWGWLYIGSVWVPERLRGRGHGTQLVRKAEALAVTHGCTARYLETFEFQARGFYERLGYAVYGVLEDFPVGSRRYSLRKAL